MPKPITVEQLKAMSMAERYALYENALKAGTPEAKDVIGKLMQHQLLGRLGGGLPRSHPTIRSIEDVTRSAEGRAAAKEAADGGLPALAGVDPLLQQRLGQDYGTQDTTNWAGFLVAEVMDELGYKQVAKKPMPSSCVAKTAAFFVKK